MSVLLNAIKQFPFLCGAFEPEREARIIEMIWNDELKNNDSVFHENVNDTVNPPSRIRFAFRWDCEDKRKKEYCSDLVMIKYYTHEIEKHGRNDLIRKRDDLLEGFQKRPRYPDVDEVLPLSMSLTSFWDG